MFAPDQAEDESYFDEAPLRGRNVAATTTSVPAAGTDEPDPLDAYMDALNSELSKEPATQSKPKASLDDLETEDPVASYFESWEKAGGKKPVVGEDGELIENEEEEEGDRRAKAIEPLPAIDHSQVNYARVQTEFYKAHPEVAAMTAEQVEQLKSELKISATGSQVPYPVASFAHLADCLGKELMAGIRQHGFHQPTPIQAQAIPVALSGRDVIGIAETGSGKTLAYLLPMLVHAIAQPELRKGEGPIGLVLCPTRELAVQIEEEVYKFNKLLGLSSVTLAGGLSKLEQFKEVKRGCEIAICNPGRLIDVVKMKGCTLRRVTFVVLDEADRMFHMGFEYQVRSIVQNVRPSRQTLLFSATFPPKIEKLARDLLQQPIRITVGAGGQAASSIVQSVEIMKKEEDKWAWLAKRIDGMLEKGQVLIFVKSIASAEELTQNFKDLLEKKTEILHGDLDQSERMRILRDVRKTKVDVLIATDVAARGLDIPSIGTVVSFDVARDIETHTHRIGRTGRAGAAGQAFTLLTSNDESKKMAALLAESLEVAGQTVSAELTAVAMKYGPYRSAKLSGQKFTGKKKGGGGGKSVASTYGIGFDGQAKEKETPQDLERRLNSEADRMAAVNRRIMEGTGRGGRFNMAAATQAAGGRPAGFVAAATADEPVQLPTQPKKDDSDSDEDLFAPGVTAAFGGGGPSRGMKRPFAAQQMTAPMQVSQSVMEHLQQQQQMAQLQQMAQMASVQQGFSEQAPQHAAAAAGQSGETPRASGFSRRSRSRSRGRRSSRERSRSRDRRRRRFSSP